MSHETEGITQNNADWTRTTDIDRAELLLAGRNTTFVPELYVGDSQAKIQTDANDGSDNISNNVSLLNAIVNLGYNFSEHLKFGLTVSNANLDFNQKESTGSGANAYSLDGTQKSNITTIGLGSTLLLGTHFAVGGFYTKILDGENSEITQVTAGGSPNKITNDGSLQHEKFGVGIAFQSGGLKADSGFRVEISHTRLNFQLSPGLMNADGSGNAQTRIAVEASKWGFVGGVNVTRTYGQYIDYKYYLDSVIAEFPAYTTPKDEIGGFIGFKASGGSSVAVSGSYLNGAEPSKLFGQDVTSQTNMYSISAHYAYAF